MKLGNVTQLRYGHSGKDSLQLVRCNLTEKQRGGSVKMSGRSVPYCRYMNLTGKNVDLSLCLTS
jgi:hypothetical protein